MEKYPTITFTSTNVEQAGGQNYKVTGKLTLHGVTRPITFDVTYRGENSMMGMRTGLRASTTINRHDFSLGQGAAVRVAASSMVAIEIDLEAVQQSVGRNGSRWFTVSDQAEKNRSVKKFFLFRML